MTKRRTSKMDRQIAKMVNEMTTEQYLKLLDIADPNPMTKEERAELEALTDEELLAELAA